MSGIAKFSLSRYSFLHYQVWLGVQQEVCEEELVLIEGREGLQLYPAWPGVI